MLAYGNQRSKWDAGCRFDFPNPDYHDRFLRQQFVQKLAIGLAITSLLNKLPTQKSSREKTNIFR